MPGKQTNWHQQDDQRAPGRVTKTSLLIS